MAEQSHRDEMNAAIRAQRERHAAPRTIAPSDEAAETPGREQQAEEQSAPDEPRKSLLDRLRGR
jgi:hypothetical protein